MKKLKQLSVVALLFTGVITMAQSTGIGTTEPDLSAALEVASNNKGFLPPRLTDVQRDAITDAATGLMIYNTTEDCLQINTGSRSEPDWKCIGFVPGEVEVGALDCSGAVNGSFKVGEASEGTKEIAYTGGNGGKYNINVTANGLTVSGQGSLTIGKGNITLAVSGTAVTAGATTFTVEINGISCDFDVIVIPVKPEPLPGNIVLTAGQEHMIASVFDTDYLPYTTPTGPATTLPQAADGTADPKVDIQGTLTTTGVTINIPYRVSGAAVTVPAFSQTITLPESLIEGSGGSHDVVLSYPSKSLSGTGTIAATLKAVGSTLNVKKLDINSGIGNDAKGVLIAEFTLATDNAGGTGTVQLRGIAGIPDRAFGDGTHNFLYLPIVSKTGKAWLNNNLGANYNHISNAVFNPAQQAKSSTDHHAYGSLYQWGRNSDGHELIKWNSGTSGTPVNGSTSTIVGSDTPGHSNFIFRNSSPYDWRSPQNNNLWQGERGINNPCPQGFRAPTKVEMQAEITAYSITNSTSAYNSIHKFVFAGFRQYSTAIFFGVGSRGTYWTRTNNSTESMYYNFEGSSISSSDIPRTNAMSVRCIQD